MTQGGSERKHPQWVSKYVIRLRLQGLSFSDIAHALYDRWPDRYWTKDVALGIYHRHYESDSGLLTKITLPGPEWSVPQECIPVGNSWERAA